MEKIKTAEFESRSIPFSDSPTGKQLVDKLSDEQLMFIEQFIFSLGVEKATKVLQGMTPEKISLMLELYKERAKAMLAISRWNYMAKSVKYSFFSLALSMTVGYFGAWLLEDTIYNPFRILKGYLGMKWMERWFIALFIGSMHNVYDSFHLQRVIRKVAKFCDEWMASQPKGPSNKEEKEELKTSNKPKKKALEGA